MIKETKYIFRRILIGVGIVLVLSLINSCKVKAYNISNNYASISKSNITTNSDWLELKTYNYVSFYKNNSNEHYAFCASFNNTCYEFWSYSSYIANNVGVLIASHSSNSNSTLYYSCAYLSEATLPKITAPAQFFDMTFYSNTSEYCISTKNSDNYINMSHYIAVDSNNNAMSGVNSGAYNQPSSIYQWYSTIEWNYYGNQYVSENNIIGVSPSPLIDSLQPLKVNQESYIVSYLFRPKFSIFDTDNYIYQYRVGINGSWLNISQNEEQITINNNNTIYFRILDKSNNELVDSQTFTITDIGFLNTNLNYSIDFSTDYETLENTNIISKYFVNINYLPKSSILKYQYQFVSEGSSLDNNNWVSLDSEVFSYNFETSLNGTLYARILDSEDIILTTNTFTITEIGKFAINNNDKKNKNFFDKISSSINFSGPISGIINIPINLIRVLSSAIASNTCTNYNLGSLWGTNLVIPCVNIKQHLGNSLYSTIDLICACVMIYYIFKMFGELYTNLLFMHKNPIQDLGRRGD